MRILIGIARIVVLVAGAAAAAQVPAANVRFDIPAQALETALLDFSQQARMQIVVANEAAKGISSPAVQGEYPVTRALAMLLEGSGLGYRVTDERTIAVGALGEGDPPPAISSAMRDDWSEKRLAQLSGQADGTEEGGNAPGSGAQDHLDEVVVTAKRKFRPENSSAASKLDLPVIETPQALTVIGSELLDIAKLNDTAAVAAYTAGLENNGLGDGTEVALSARGFEIDRQRSYRVNGLSVDNEVDLDYFAMDRVEIVRGPASSLYGEADYGATINRVLKKPVAKLGGSFGLEGGSDQYRRIDADVTAPLGENGFAGRAIGVYQEGGGFMRDTNLKHWLIAPSAGWTGENTEVLLQAYYSKFDGPTSDGFPLVIDDAGRYRLPDVPRSRNYGSTIDDIDSTNQLYFGRLTHRFGDSLKLTLNAAFSKVTMFNNTSYLYDLDDAEGDGIADLYYFLEDKDKENLSYDAALEKSFEWAGREQRLLVSADWRKEKLFQPYGPDVILGTLDFLNDGGPLPATRPDLGTGSYFDSWREYSGVSMLAYLKPTDRIAMLAGLRYSRIESGFRDFYYGDLVTDDGKDDAWVPRFGMTYRLGEGQYAFASYSEGVIFNETALDASRRPVKPEQGAEYEVGIKGEIFSKRLFYALSAFTIDRTNIADLVPGQLPGEPEVYRNVGRQTHQGVELEMQGEPLPGFNVYFSYAFLDAKIKESTEVGEAGRTPATAPRNSLSLFATYEVLSGPLKSLTFGGGLVNRSKREIDSFGTFQLPSYTRVDLRGSYDVTERLTVELNAKNIFNDAIYTSVFESTGAGNAFTDVRSVIAGVSYRF